MAWLIVMVAGLFETAFAVLLKQSHGITRLGPTVGFAICALISFGLLTYALKNVPALAGFVGWLREGAPPGVVLLDPAAAAPRPAGGIDAGHAAGRGGQLLPLSP